MSENTATAQGGGEHGHHTNYVKIWGILLGLLVVSVVGPMLGIRVVTLITAFGIALVKAYLVAKYFMHVNLERKWIIYLVVGMVVLMLVMVGGVSPDVLKHDGARWSNDAAKNVVQEGLKHAPSHEGEGGAHHEGG